MSEEQIINPKYADIYQDFSVDEVKKYVKDFLKTRWKDFKVYHLYWNEGSLEIIPVKGEVER